MKPITERPAPEPLHRSAAAPEVAADLDAPNHDEWLLDESLRETFPASDPISPACEPHSDRR